ncbi:MAG: hypothetical protein N2053_07290, partial [Chitinispirillaceae bacterium]|nr:hypothetical protein [Chitinispirillaceae bacterium]
MRRRSMRVVGVLCFMFVLNVLAQFTPNNSRRSGLGGTFIIDDMVDVLRYPVFMDFYKDDIQVTFNSPIMGIKGIGDMINLGVIANRGLLLDNSSVNSFYQAGSATLAGNITGAPQVSAQNLPHILFGLNLAAVKLGFDLFYEYAASSYKSETQPTPSTVTTAHARIHHPGLIASALFGPENIPIAVKFGIGFPLISGKFENATTVREAKSDRGIFIEGGGEVELPVSELKVSAGADWIMESYAFAIDNADPTTTYTNNKIAFYGGCEGEVMTTAKWGAMYNLAILSGKTRTAADTTTTTNV